MKNGRRILKRNSICVISEHEREAYRLGVKPRCHEHDHIDRNTAQEWSDKLVNGQPWARWEGPHHIVTQQYIRRSPASITAKESMAAVGIGSPGQIRAARAKVETYQGEGRNMRTRETDGRFHHRSITPSSISTGVRNQPEKV
jgi:hypothetical protein